MSRGRTVDIVCAGCGFEYQVSDRYARMLRCEGRAPYCRGCEAERRRKTPVVEVSPIVADAEARFWINLFGFEEAVELALVIWGPPGRRRNPDTSLALVASADE